MNRTLPCPFCGHTGVSRMEARVDGEIQLAATCHNCGARGPKLPLAVPFHEAADWNKAAELAERLWNVRPDEPIETFLPRLAGDRWNVKPKH